MLSMFNSLEFSRSVYRQQGHAIMNLKLTARTKMHSQYTMSYTLEAFSLLLARGREKKTSTKKNRVEREAPQSMQGKLTYVYKVRTILARPVRFDSSIPYSQRRATIDTTPPVIAD